MRLIFTYQPARKLTTEDLSLCNRYSHHSAQSSISNSVIAGNADNNSIGVIKFFQRLVGNQIRFSVFLCFVLTIILNKGFTQTTSFTLTANTGSETYAQGRGLNNFYS